MADALRVILLVALAAAALTTGALVLNWWMEPVRRMRRALLKSLGATPEAEALSPAEGRAAGLDFDGAQVAVLWNRGGAGLVYAFEEIEGGEIIVDGLTGLIVPAANPDALAGAMGRLLAMGPDGRRIMGEAALVRVRKRFTTSALQKATLAVYEGLTGQAR